MLRSYLGFDAVPVRVTGSVQRYDLAPHWSRLADTRGSRTETQEHGLIEFQDGRTGIFHWTDVGYDSALRWWRSSRFLAERGMGITVGVGLEVQERLVLLSPDGEAPHFITLERQWERVDGGALLAMMAHTGDPQLPTIRWENPFPSCPPGARDPVARRRDRRGRLPALPGERGQGRNGTHLWAAPGSPRPGDHPGTQGFRSKWWAPRKPAPGPAECNPTNWPRKTSQLDSAGTPQAHPPPSHRYKREIP